MKIDPSTNCSNCPLRCDIYNAFISSGLDPINIHPLQALFRKHENICKQGSLVTSAIFMVEGSAKLFIEGQNNRNILLYILSPRSYIGLLSFFDTPAYSYSVSALENSRVCMVDLPLIKTLYIDHHDFLIKLNKAFGKSVGLIMKKIITLHQKNARGRVADSLLTLSEYFQSSSFQLHLTRKELGEMSGVSEENTVRLLSELKQEGMIHLEGKHITISDKSLLRKISDFG